MECYLSIHIKAGEVSKPYFNLLFIFKTKRAILYQLKIFNASETLRAKFKGGSTD